mmetsp:Transcript_42208/g.78997  ORF Transcript_42208/g.78997 Transcript_42208/m.78997 type:complete len:136 (-) Transcript_42208:78-485(-)
MQLCRTVIAVAPIFLLAVVSADRDRRVEHDGRAAEGASLIATRRYTASVRGSQVREHAESKGVIDSRRKPLTSNPLKPFGDVGEKKNVRKAKPDDGVSGPVVMTDKMNSASIAQIFSSSPVNATGKTFDVPLDSQ